MIELPKHPIRKSIVVFTLPGLLATQATVSLPASSQNTLREESVSQSSGLEELTQKLQSWEAHEALLGAGLEGRPAKNRIDTLWGNRIRKAREHQGLTPTQVAAKAGVSQAWISMLENGRRKPSYRVARRLERVLGIRLTDVILPGSGDGGRPTKNRINTPWGNRIRKARKHQGLTPAQTAAKAGVSQPFLSMLENGLRKPSYRVARRLERVLDINLEDVTPSGLRTGLEELDQFLRSSHIRSIRPLLRERGRLTTVTDYLDRLPVLLRQAGYREGKLWWVPNAPVPPEAFHEKPRLRVFIQPQWERTIQAQLKPEANIWIQLEDRPDIKGSVLIGDAVFRKTVEEHLESRQQTYLQISPLTVDLMDANLLGRLLIHELLRSGRILYVGEFIEEEGQLEEATQVAA